MEPAAKPQALCVSKKVFPARWGIFQSFKKLLKIGTKKAALTAASLAEQKEGKRKGRKQMKRGKCDYL